MANRSFLRDFATLLPGTTYIQGSWVVGASGAVSSLRGAGVTSVTRLAQGVYRFILDDNYNYFYNASFSIKSPVTGSAVTAGAFSVGTLYQIVTLGTTDYHLVGLPANMTAAVGQSFVATGVGTGTGTVKALAASGIYAWESAGDNQTQLSPRGTTKGAVVIYQTLNASGALTDPASGSVVHFHFFLRNGSTKGKGEP